MTEDYWSARMQKQLGRVYSLDVPGKGKVIFLTPAWVAELKRRKVEVKEPTGDELGSFVDEGGTAWHFLYQDSVKQEQPPRPPNRRERRAWAAAQKKKARS